MARRLQHPLFFLSADSDSPENSLIQVSNELLAEAQMSLFRGLTRLAVLNSYGAVEGLANAVFAKTKTDLLVSHNVPKEIADRLVEEERQRHKTEPSFLFHRGLQESCNRSLLAEDKGKYDGLLDLQRMRHLVAHTGLKPSADEARDAHKLACECTRWLAEVGGLPVKPLLPAIESQAQGFSSTASDSHAISPGEFEFLRYALGFAGPNRIPPSGDGAQASAVS